MESTSKKIPDVIRDPSRWRSTTPGIPDEYFERTQNVPITKEEVRSIIISKARLRTGDCVLEVGSGSGSITIEAAIQVGGGGVVVAIDHDEAAVALTKKNVERFGLEGMTRVVYGDAINVVKKGEGLPFAGRAQAVIIGGTGGDTAKIMKSYSDMLDAGGRMAVSTIQIETLHAVLDAMYEMPFEEVDVTQVTISKSRKTSTGTMMLARNPVTVVSATKC